ncbi:TPA: hypothetical protein ACMEOC_004865 [Klebsiella pneumoniae]|uniref:hypothetical protein n=1 Tax=Klebsiella pneumoniae TaxID=573 RepID=UPI0030813A43
MLWEITEWYIETTKTLANMFYAIPLLMFQIALTLAFIFGVILPISKIKGLKNLDSNAAAPFMAVLGLPALGLIFLTFGMTGVAFLTVISKIFNLNIL